MDANVVDQTEVKVDIGGAKVKVRTLGKVKEVDKVVPPVE